MGRWYNIKRWGSWRFAFVMARLQRTVWKQRSCDTSSNLAAEKGSKRSAPEESDHKEVEAVLESGKSARSDGRRLRCPGSGSSSKPKEEVSTPDSSARSAKDVPSSKKSQGSRSQKAPANLLSYFKPLPTPEKTTKTLLSYFKVKEEEERSEQAMCKVKTGVEAA